MEENKIIPQQKEGGYSDTSSEQQFESAEQAAEFFQMVKQRVLHINDWERHAGGVSADFKLFDQTGNTAERAAQEGDFFRIDIPGPGTLAGDGYDWVRVERIKEDRSKEEECIAIQVRPAPSPVNDKEDVAHFFNNQATSTFIISRKKNTVRAAVHGRNEKPNTDTETVIDTVRNTAVAAGAITAFSKIQWKNLVEGLLRIKS